MPRIVKLQPENADAEYLPPTFYLKFSQEEFPAFLANPTATMKELGHPVKKPDRHRERPRSGRR